MTSSHSESSSENSQTTDNPGAPASVSDESEQTLENPSKTSTKPIALHDRLERCGLLHETDTLNRCDSTNERPTANTENLRCQSSSQQNSTTVNSTEAKGRCRLGRFQLTILVGGPVLCLGILAFLTFLWAHQSEADDGASARYVWRAIINHDWILQAITLCALALRFVVTTQAAICTSFVASLIFEQRQFPLSWSASLSIHRSVNGGPYSFLNGMLALKSKVWALLRCYEVLLLLVICIGDVGLQFASTLLLTDIKVGLVVDFPKTSCRNITAPERPLVRGLEVPPSDLAVFGESVRRSFAAPDASGLSDTDVLVHAMLPMVANRTATRMYRGPAYVVRSRAACMPPQMKSVDIHPEYIQLYPGGNRNDWVSESFTGTIDFRSTLEKAGVTLPSSFSPDSYPSSFNCTQSYEGYPSLCVFQRNQPFYPNETWQGIDFWSTGWDWSTMDPWMSNPEIFLAYHFENYKMEGGMPFPDPQDPSIPKTQWQTLQTPTGPNVVASLCFHNWNISLEEVVLSTDTDLEDKPWALRNLLYGGTVDAAATFLGADPRKQLPEQRGTLKIQHASQPLNNYTFQRQNSLQVGGTIMSSQLPSSFSGFPSAPLQSTVGRCADCSHYEWALEYISLWENLIALTENPATALQIMKLLSAQSIHDQMVPAFTECAQTEEVTVVLRSRPAGNRFAGLITVAVFYVVIAACVVVLTLLYVRNLRFSHVDSFWHTISQVALGGDDTVRRALLYGANNDDEEVAQRLLENGEDCLVRLQPSGEIGRVGGSRVK